MIPPADLHQFVMSSVATICNRAPADVTPETTLLEVGMDSTSFVVLVAHIENACGCELRPEEILSISQASAVADLISRLTEITQRASGVQALLRA